MYRLFLFALPPLAALIAFGLGWQDHYPLRPVYGLPIGFALALPVLGLVVWRHQVRLTAFMPILFVVAIGFSHMAGTLVRIGDFQLLSWSGAMLLVALAVLVLFELDLSANLPGGGKRQLALR